VTGGILFPESETTINTQVLIGREVQQRMMIAQKPEKRELETFTMNIHRLTILPPAIPASTGI